MENECDGWTDGWTDRLTECKPIVPPGFTGGGLIKRKFVKRVTIMSLEFHHSVILLIWTVKLDTLTDTHTQTRLKLDAQA